MDAPTTVNVQAKRGAEDSGRYFKYMAEFVGLTPADADIIQQTKPIIEKHLPDIVAKFYAHLLRYPPTRKFFLKKDHSIDQDYVELRMRHLTNFWLRTASGIYDDDYARYIDYIGRAHTSHGADPRIYIAERYVIGQVGFVQHAIGEALIKELRHVDEDLEASAMEAWDKLLMVILEMLARAYGHEREAETFDALVPVDQTAVDRLAIEAFELEHGAEKVVPHKDVVVARAADIPEGERKIVQVDGLSIGVFHHEGKWYALRNSCLHRGGPVATGRLDGDTLTCPWHGFQYNVTTGQLLVDPSAHLDSYRVDVREGEVHLEAPVSSAEPAARALGEAPKWKENEFRTSEVAPGQTKLVRVNGQSVAVYNVEGAFFATQAACTHQGGPLEEGDLDGNVITCPMHGSQFDVSTGKVVRGPANQTLKTFRVSVEGEIGRVEEAPNAVTATTKSETRQLEENEFRTNEIAPGETLLVQVEGGVAVYNVGGVFYATQDECPHAGGPLSEGKLDGKIITCPWHGSCFDVTTGEVRRGPATKPTKTFRVTVEGEIGRVEKNS